MENTSPDSEDTEISKLEQAIDKEIALTVTAYEALLHRCKKLAKTIGYREDYIIGKVMPKTASDRTNSSRIAVWFSKERDEIIEHMQQMEAHRQQKLERAKLLESLKLTSYQKELLGIS
jgi:hypothetical protein